MKYLMHGVPFPFKWGSVAAVLFAILRPDLYLSPDFGLFEFFKAYVSLEFGLALVVAIPLTLLLEFLWRRARSYRGEQMR
jgi:hypothetical protein